MINSVNIKDNERFIEIGLLVNGDFSKLFNLMCDNKKERLNRSFFVFIKV